MQRDSLAPRIPTMVLALALVALGLMAATRPGSAGTSPTSPTSPLRIRPNVSDYKQINSSTTPPTEAQCFSVGRRCFTPQAIQASYNLGPLYALGNKGQGITIAIVDSYGSDTMAHDLHVYDQAFGLQPMCGEEGITCLPGLPK